MKLFTNTYAQLVKLGKDAMRDTMAPLRAREMRLQAQTRAAQLESQIAEAEQKLVELGSAYPIDFDKLTAAMDSAALLRRRKEQFDVIIEELFPSEPAPSPGKAPWDPFAGAAAKAPDAKAPDAS
jgi:hypothetical protein